MDSNQVIVICKGLAWHRIAQSGVITPPLSVKVMNVVYQPQEMIQTASCGTCLCVFQHVLSMCDFLQCCLVYVEDLGASTSMNLRQMNMSSILRSICPVTALLEPSTLLLTCV